MAGLKNLSWIVVILIFIPWVTSFPQPPCQFYGDVSIGASYAVNGTVVNVYDDDAQLCGTVAIESPGKYLISCRSDDPSTGRDEGAGYGEEVTFTVNGSHRIEKGICKPGGFSRLDLTDIGFVTKPEESLSPRSFRGQDLLLVCIFIVIFALSYYRYRQVRWE